jgi:hypothetical protein
VRLEFLKMGFRSPTAVRESVMGWTQRDQSGEIVMRSLAEPGVEVVILKVRDAAILDRAAEVNLAA